MRETLEIIAKYPSVANAAQEMRALARDALRRADYVPVANREDPVGPLVDLYCRARDWITRRSVSSSELHSDDCNAGQGCDSVCRSLQSKAQEKARATVVRGERQ